MAKRLQQFPVNDAPQSTRRYPWIDWTDGGIWEIQRGSDYDVPTENMRVNLHVKADALSRKVKTRKISSDDSEGLVFQFLESEEMELMKVENNRNPQETKAAVDQLYADALEIYERARTEVTIERKDGTKQRYAPIRFKRQIEKGREENELVPTVARIVRKPTLGFGHLENAERPDLMLETLVLDTSKPYHRLFTPNTVEIAHDRMAQYHDGAA